MYVCRVSLNECSLFSDKQGDGFRKVYVIRTLSFLCLIHKIRCLLLKLQVNTRHEAELGKQHFRTVPHIATFNVIGRNGC